MREAETTTSTETQGHSTTFGPTGQQATPGPDQGTSPPVAVAEPATVFTPLSFRQPRRSDGAALHRLVSECPPLDVNSLYAYLLLCEHFSATCVVAESAGGRIDGFISAYLPPTRPDVIFVWQVAVHSRARGQRLGRAMLRELLQRDELKHVRHLETTVGPDNQASRRMFAGLAGELGAHIAEQPFFDRQLFGGADHDDEMLLKIGPFALSPQ